MKCPFCWPKRDVKEWDLRKEQHLIVTKNINGKFHVHGPTDNKQAMRELLLHTCEYASISLENLKKSNCPFCNTQVPEWSKDLLQHLIVTVDHEKHFHIHGPIEDKPLMERFVEEIISTVGLEELKKVNKQPPKKVIFRNKQAIGDILTFTAAIRDFKKAFPDTEVGVISTAMHIWDHNPYVNLDITLDSEDQIINVGPGFLTNKSNTVDLHLCNAFRCDIENKLGITFPQTAVYPDVWMTEEEYNRPPLIKGPYWIICVSGEPGWPVKMYPAERWQEVVDSLPEINFVQIGLQKQKFVRLKNVTNFIGKTEDPKTGIRDLFNLFLHAQGSVGLVSMQTHLSAAFRIPSVTIAGAREPSWFTHYLGHQYLQTNGCLPCATREACWKCKMEGCIELQKRAGMIPNTEIPPCVDIIGAQEVVTCIRKYYDGGRLQYGEKIPNTRFKNITKEAKVFVKKPQLPVDSSLPAKFGMDWGGADVTDKDWTFIESLINNYDLKKIIIFGRGLLPLLLIDKGIQHLTIYSIDKTFIDNVNKVVANNSVNARVWDGEDLFQIEQGYDLAIVDGPPGGKNREYATKYGALASDIVLIHDENREWEHKWRDKYLVSDFDLKSKGGNRCALWVNKKKALKEVKRSNIKLVPIPGLEVLNTTPISKPTVRLISTARGWGGCARSITTIMKLLIEHKCKVEFVPLHSKYTTGAGIGREFRECLVSDLKEVSVRDWSAISEPASVTLLYTDDYIWEFGAPDVVEVFSNIKSDRKLMFINYRLGQVGKIPWTQDWDHYGALNSGIIKDLENVYPNCRGKTSVMPPCIDITPYLNTKLDYEKPLTIVRHSSQGDTKYSKDTFNDELKNIHTARPRTKIHLMPAPSFCINANYIIKHKKNQPPIPEFLNIGNLYWYSVPTGYKDMGPRVIVEAMASGLACISDAGVGGPDDRILHGKTGYLCENKKQHVEYMKSFTSSDLKHMGIASRERVIDNWAPDKWVAYILGIKG